MPTPYPAELPERPIGWKRRMKVHFNYGRGKGAMIYAVFDAEDKETVITYGYDTRPGGKTGFSLPDVDDVMTWAELRARWPAWVAARCQSCGAPAAEQKGE